MNTINPRNWARGPKPLVGIRAIERMLLRHTVTHTPEVRLVVALICNAMADCLVGEPTQRAEAQSFMRDWRLGVWADAVGLHPDFVREVAAGARYLGGQGDAQSLPPKCAGPSRSSADTSNNTRQRHDKRVVHA